MSKFWNLLHVRPDRAALYAASGTLVRFATGPVTMLVIATSLTQAEQGYYVTFFSVFAAYQLIEAGMGFVATQGIASRIQGLILRRGDLEGPMLVMDAIRDRIAFVLLWFLLVAGIAALPVHLIGVHLFRSGGPGVAWEIPWALYVFASAVGIVVSSLGAVLEGLQQSHLTFRAQLMAAVVSAGVLWTTLALGGHLYALPAAVGATVAVQAVLLGYPLRRVLGNLAADLFYAPRRRVYVCRDILLDCWPFFSRMAVTWTLGFFYWNSLPLLTFWSFGPVYAGQLGLSMNLLRAGLQFTESFLSSQRGRLSALLTQDPTQAWDLYQVRNRLAHGVLLVGYGVFFVALGFLPESLRGRLLPTGEMVGYAIAFLAMLYPLNSALLLRCTGREAFFSYSLAMNLILPVGLLAATSLDHPEVVAIIFTMVHLAFLPWARRLILAARLASGGAK